MAEPIEFPLNFVRYMELGQEALAISEFAEAEFNFTKAYNLKADFEANLSLVESLVSQSKFATALAIANEMKTNYVHALPLVKIYVRLLLGNGEFIQARKLLRQLHLPKEELKDLVLEVEQGEQIFKLYQQQDLNDLLKQKTTVSEGNFFQQAEILKSWQKLPLDHYVSLVKEVIEGNLVNHLLKNSLLNDLVELGREATLSLTLLTGEVEIITTDNLPEIDQQKSFQGARQALRQQLPNEDSDLSRQLQEELRLQFSLLYPVADSLVTEPSLWVELFLANYLGGEISPATELISNLENYRTLQEKISLELLKIFGA